VVAQQKGKSLLLVFLLFFAFESQAQIVINAMVADSATLRPLSDVNVKLKNSLRGTTSSIAGYFVINTAETDTLVFSRVGYFTKEYPAIKLKETMIVYLAEELLLLQPVTITGRILLPGMDRMVKETPFVNPNAIPGYVMPGFQGLETFGPGIKTRGALSKYSREAREKKRLVLVREENKKGKSYIQIVNDPEVKDFLMKEHSLSEDEFNKMLAVFNEKNKDFMYELEEQDLVSFLKLFFADEVKKK
jgi:hypothetical protein